MSTHAEVVNVSSQKVEQVLKKFMQANNCRRDEVDTVYLSCHVFAGNLYDFIRTQPKGAWVIHVPCCAEAWSRRVFVAEYLESTGEGQEPIVKSVRYRFGPEKDSIRDLDVRCRAIRGTERLLEKRF